MTLLDPVAAIGARRKSTPTLETERLVLRAPGLDDAEALARLVNDRRIAENTLRIPHPYELADACAFIAAANAGHHEVSFLICARDGALLGGCGIALSAMHRRSAIGSVSRSGATALQPRQPGL
jgi:RimJ/RimL family protein N-acetyltransferase